MRSHLASLQDCLNAETGLSRPDFKAAFRPPSPPPRSDSTMAVADETEEERLRKERLLQQYGEVEDGFEADGAGLAKPGVTAKPAKKSASGPAAGDGACIAFVPLQLSVIPAQTSSSRTIMRARSETQRWRSVRQLQQRRHQRGRRTKRTSRSRGALAPVAYLGHLRIAHRGDLQKRKEDARKKAIKGERRA